MWKTAILKCWLCFRLFLQQTQKTFVYNFVAPLRTIHLGKFHHTSSLLSESYIIKSPDKILIENCLFAGKSLNNQLLDIFNNWFVFSSDTHRYETSCFEKGMLKLKSFNSKPYDKEAVIYSAINKWNILQSIFHCRTFLFFSLNFFWKIIIWKSINTNAFMFHVSCLFQLNKYLYFAFSFPFPLSTNLIFYNLIGFITLFFSITTKIHLIHT